VPSGLERELGQEADLLARERSCGRKSYDYGKSAGSHSDSRGLLAYKSEFSKNYGRRCNSMLVIRHKILADDQPIRGDKILDGMRNAMCAQAESNVGVQDSKAPYYRAIPIGQQRDLDPVFLCKMLEGFPGVVANRGEAEAFPFEHRARLFQLDQLGSAVLSPIGASVKNEEQAIGTGEIRDRAHHALLVREGEIGYALASLRARGVAIVGRMYTLSAL